MENSKFKLGLIFSIILLFFSASLIPSISGDTNNIDNLLTKGTPKSCSLNDDESLAYWSFDEGSGTTAYDYSGHSFDGLIYGADWTTGYLSYALDFNGNSDYVSVDTYSEELGFNKSDDYKISVWIKSTSNDAGMIYQVSSDIYILPIAYIRLNPDGTLEVKVQATEECGVEVHSTNTYNDGLWHYIEFIYHGCPDTSDPTLELYIDQEFIGSDTDYLCPMISQQFKRAKIGMKSYESAEYFHGLIDELKVYKKPGENQPLGVPIINGQTVGVVGEEYSYIFLTMDPDEDYIYYLVDWGDNTSTGWIGPYNSSENVVLSHSWSITDDYDIKARVKDTFDISDWGILHIDIFSNPNGEEPPSGDDNGTSGNGSLKTDASLSEKYGIVGVPINFDGSKSSDLVGIIVGYRWDFTSDGIYETDWLNNPKTTYTFNLEGTFKVTLQIKNNNDLTDIDQINITILKGFNNPPTKPIITGSNIETQNKNIYFTAVSTDLDNDYLQYNFSWGDSQETSSEFFASGIAAPFSHSWSNAGVYTITVYAFDNKTISETTSFVILIDVCFVEKIGYLLDSDSDGIYDIFHFNYTGMETIAKKTNDGYLLDTNGDGKSDYIYDLESGLSSYTEEKNGEKTPGFELISVVCAIALVLLWKKKRKL